MVSDDRSLIPGRPVISGGKPVINSDGPAFTGGWPFIARPPFEMMSP